MGSLSLSLLPLNALRGSKDTDGQIRRIEAREKAREKKLLEQREREQRYAGLRDFETTQLQVNYAHMMGHICFSSERTD